MNSKEKIINGNNNLIICVVYVLLSVFNVDAQIPDSSQGLRADWMRGSWGVLWLPERTYNGNIEGITIDDFIIQIKDLRTIDYVQLPLTSPNIFSPVHTGPNNIIESLWHGDTDTNGDPINLVVPRASVDDPLLSWLKAVRAAGLRTEIYVNSYNLLARFPEDIQENYPDISARWEKYCDTNEVVQTFLNSQSYHVDGIHDRRPYMFAYAEFILKEYAIRYGDLIDAWCFDSADNIMEDECGDNPSSENLEDQRIYEAFAGACHAGNPNAAVAFNNSVGDREGNPYSIATYFDDYSFGHPFGGAGNMVVPEILYTYNFGVCEFMQDNNGYSFRDDSRIWNDNVVAHFFPKQSTTSWNAGNEPCLTDEQFVYWNSMGLINGGAITWGTPLVRTNLENSPILTLQPYSLTQLELTDNHLQEYQYSGSPNWARQRTVLPVAYVGIPYLHTLTNGVDFWDSEGNAIISLLALGNVPSWLTITEISIGVWSLSGTPNDTFDTSYEFNLQIRDVSYGSNRDVILNVFEEYIPEITTVDVEVKGEPNINYGLATVAKMYSDIQTAPDGLATYKVSIDVTPPSNKAIISGASGGLATTNSWGLGDGTDANSDYIFTGIDNEWVENIGNIQIVDFNSNGSPYSLDDIISTSFSAITIVNAQSSNDFVSFMFDGTTTDYGKTSEQLETIDLKETLGVTWISDFSIGTGNQEATNKWSVYGIDIVVEFSEKTLSVEIPINETIFKFYPNPVIDIVSFKEKPLSVQVFDTIGRLVKSDVSGEKSLDLSELPSGIYTVKILNTENKLFLKQFLKK